MMPKFNTSPARGRLAALVAVVAMAAAACDVISAAEPCCPPQGLAPSRPAHWMFQPSYFSHDLQGEQWNDPTLPSQRTAYRIPTVGQNPGVAVESRYRINTFVLRNGPNSFDVQIRRTGGVEVRP